MLNGWAEALPQNMETLCEGYGPQPRQGLIRDIRSFGPILMGTIGMGTIGMGTIGMGIIGMGIIGMGVIRDLWL